MMSDDRVVLRQLDEAIASADRDVERDDTPENRFRAARSVLEKAELLESVGGASAAVPAYVNLVERLKALGAETDHPALVANANTLAILYWETGDRARSRELAEWLLESYLGSGLLDDQHRSLANAGNLLAQVLHAAGDTAGGLGVLRRVEKWLDGLDPEACPVDERDSLLAKLWAVEGELRGTLGEAEYGRRIDLYRRIADVYRAHGRREDEYLYSGALYRHSDILWYDEPTASRALRLEILTECANSDDPYVQADVSWARESEEAIKAAKKQPHRSWWRHGRRGSDT